MPENKPSKRRTYTREFKLKVLGEIEAGKSQAQAARDYQLTEIAIYKWRQQLKKYKEHAFAGPGQSLHGRSATAWTGTHGGPQSGFKIPGDVATLAHCAARERSPGDDSR